MPPLACTRRVLSWAPVFGILVLFAISACRPQTRPLIVKLIDQKGQPLPGAIFYAESFTNPGGTFDFAWGESGPDGSVITIDGESMQIGWKTGARLSYAAFSPGMKPSAFIDYLGRATDSSFDIILSDTSQTALDWQPTLSQLEFPFESKPDQARRLAEIANRRLLMIFLEAYEPIASGAVPSTPEEQTKLAFIKKLLKNSK